MAALRVLRYLVVTVEDLEVMNDVQIPFLIVRSMDIVLNNSGERLNAARLCQQILAIPDGASHFPSPISRALVAIGFDGLIEHDKLHRASLSILCQLALLNPMHFIECGGVRVLLHNLLACTSPMVLEGILGSLLHLLNVPETREAARINLQYLVAPFTDLHFKHGGHEPRDKQMDERELGYRCAKVAIGIVLRSWSGLAEFCQTRDSGLQALIDSLCIEQLEIRRTILDLICEIVGLKFPTWTDEVSVALSAVDPSCPKDSWRLQEGFIVDEALSVLPHLATSTPNITANHMALIVFSFARKGLLDALVEVIVTSDTFISVRATVLLGELLTLVDKYVPLDCFDPSQCIPSLIRYSVGDSPTSAIKGNNFRSPFASQITPQYRQQRAMEAITVLSCLHKIKTQPVLPHSVFLQSQLTFAGYVSKKSNRFTDRLGLVQLNRILSRDVESNPVKLLRDTGVINSKDSHAWQWDTVLTLLKWCPSALKRVEDSVWRLFLRRLTDFFKPSNNNFARMELGKGSSSLYAKVGCTLVQVIAEEIEHFSGMVLLEELLTDIAVQIDELLRNSKNPYVCFLSPNKLETTLSQVYFIMLGRLTHSPKGYKVLERGEILRRLFELVCEMYHDCYIKLVISSLSYREEYCKRILTSALSSPSDDARHYATKFLRVLVRAKLPGFSKWGIELLVNQLNDKNRAIALSALDILEEAIHDKMFLESLIALKPSLSHLGDRGLLLLVCFLSLPSGFRFLHDANFLRSEIEKWKVNFNKRYVELVEVLVRDSVSTLRRGEDGRYPERASRNQEQSKFIDIYVPPHLYGQLVQHKDGLDALLELGDIDSLIQVVNQKKCSTAEETRELKAALWAVAHFGTSVETVSILEDSGVLESMVRLGRSCAVLSVRHTIFHCLCLICVTQPGAESLRKYDWYAMPRSHHESFPLWCVHIAEKNTFMRQLELDFPNEMENFLNEPDKMSITSKTDSDSNMLLEEEDEMQFLMVESDQVDGLHGSQSQFAKEVEESSTEASQAIESIGTRKISHAHHRSQSDSQTLGISSFVKVSTSPPKTSRGNGSGSKEATPTTEGIPIKTRTTSNSSTGGVYGSFRGRVSSFFGGKSSGVGSAPSASGFYPRSSSGSWKWRRSRSDSASESLTSGISSGDSVSGHASSSLRAMLPSSYVSEHIPTLSPIPSSASIATTTCSNQHTQTDKLSPTSKEGSRLTLTEPVGRYSFTSPAHRAYRSVKIRKPKLRMQLLSDPDLYPLHPYTVRMPGSYEPRTASLDRHFVLSAGDLFSESKLVRVNSSLTSLSTPSFRLRPEAEMKGPCLMGLSLPIEFNAIFMVEPPVKPGGFKIYGEESKKSAAILLDDNESVPSLENLTTQTFDFHSISTCMGCLRLKADGTDLEIELGIREESPPKVLESITECSEAAERCSPREPIILTPVRPSVNGKLNSNNEPEVKQEEIRIYRPEREDEQTALRKEVLRHVSNMICGVGSKNNEQNLLRLKQKFPAAFKDICLYTELCAILSRYNVRLPLRRFIQELFLDIPFDEFYLLAERILEGASTTSTSRSSVTSQSDITGDTSSVVDAPLLLEYHIPPPPPFDNHDEKQNSPESKASLAKPESVEVNDHDNGGNVGSVAISNLSKGSPEEVDLK
ncbi:Rapamycin-insensitive companion of mTOR [Orchesella cincta]|uniref:Rapamycin-insensitive companion of mTOR n=1 Tax=Orchesella cincta TaxID=48709 RepID=A0A1D2N3J4_ORCCI|nr:Rapamycin-insensitive companion of mTOR [Orchesella cincta]